MVALFPVNFLSKDQVTNDDLKSLSLLHNYRKVVGRVDFGRLSSELSAIIQVTCMSGLIGSVIGGFIYSRDAYLQFINKNQATSFTDHMEAKRSLQNAVSLSFMRGAFRWSWRLALFTTMYMTASTSIAAYRGKNGILEYVAGGGIAGVLYKFKIGPAGWLAGGGLGCVLGGFAGIMTNELLKATGMTMKEVRYYNYKWVMQRSEKLSKAIKEDIETEELRLLAEYNETSRKTEDINMLDSDVK